MGKNFILLLTLISFNNLLNAQDLFDKYKIYYDRLRKQEKHDSALVVAKQMNSWAFQNETDTSLRYAVSLRYIGDCFFDNLLCVAQDSALLYWNKSLIILDKQFRFKSIEKALCYYNIGNYYYYRDQFENAFNNFNLSFDILSKSNEINMKINCLFRLGNINSHFGNNKEAIYQFEECISLSNNNQSIELESIYYGLGKAYYSILNFLQADYYFQKLTLIDSNNSEYAINRALTLKRLDNHNLATKYFERSLKIGFQLLEINPLNVWNPLQDPEKNFEIIGKSFYYLNEVDSMLHYYKLAYEISRERSGELYPRTIRYHESVGLAYFLKQEYRKALEIDSIVLKNIENTMGQNDWRYFNSAKKLARDLVALKEYNHAFNYILLFADFKKKQITENFEWLNENQKEAYWKKESSFYDNLSWFANQAFEAVPEAVGLNYNAALLTKSKMLEAKISTENYYREFDELREELTHRRRLLAKMESDGSTEKEKLEKLRKEADSLDKRLTLSWPEYAQQKKNLSITWDQVQQNLDKGEAAIEFVRFENEDDSVVYYNALVLKKGDKNPTLIKLCKEKELQGINPKMGFSAYYPLVWQPLDIVLKDIKTIYYAPSGELYNVPFHAIYAPKGKGDEVLVAKTDKRGVVVQSENASTEQNAEYLMDRYTMHQLTSTRYLAMGLKQKAKDPIANTIAMVGGVNYDYLPGSSLAPKKKKKNKNASRSSASASGKLNYLEGTKTEVEQINNKVTTSTWQTKLIENNDATEETITKLEGKEAKGILHIATHGFAFSEYDFKDTTVNKNSLRYSYRYSTNPMVRSGLILAGGNWAWTGSDTLTKLGAEQNGILTALEVSQLNLKKTKLVVLSACETGLGKIEGSEGTFGLKRGFKLAGVEQMIVSLWSVPDKETMELMTLFYSDLTKTLNPVSSFEKAQKEMRNKYPTDPEKWAGFVLVR